MIVFATADKGGSGRSVTLANVAYRAALQGTDVCYLDFDFGSPTAGSTFSLSKVALGTSDGGLHSYLLGESADFQRVDVWSASDRSDLRLRPAGAGRLVLAPGDAGGGEFFAAQDVVRRCTQLLLAADEEFDVCLVDLSAGRSYTADMVLAASASAELRNVTWRWLVFHRWTAQHLRAASGLVFGGRGLLEQSRLSGHDPSRLERALRFVSAAVVRPEGAEAAAATSAFAAWQAERDGALHEFAARVGLGRSTRIASIPQEPMLQWVEQVIVDDDVLTRRIAQPAIIEAYEALAARLSDDAAWEAP
ncbi:SCO2523 family variant P-loop protein [Cryptosporangium sp. NPDC051539]|uniref:SCO2523 family variant P-loop protein n=1 Tax=Cryptosporangium sp. NPDC051539 TaxID=3363962 RepID=UPI00379A83B7